MKTRPMAWLQRGMTLAFVSGAVVVPALVAHATTSTPYPGGDGPGGGVRGHIDIPEIRSGAPGTPFSDLFDGILIDGEDDWTKSPLPIITPEPEPVFVPGSANHGIGGDVFAPFPASGWDALLPGSALLPEPSFAAPPAVWAPTSSIPAPGVGAIVATALATFAGRRRRRID